ncbi:hypothetical protein J2Y86_000901 [Pseudomonas migulae]|uniref:hypothetical protein n=1 Tax=Pseudomonas migulae TaxID=78543 RepID=UPI00209D6545|nr:hypothetical protein [Pseudomonas migulae]MCP1496194.1 hypothetical protein [Pseudomonas migulae]
MLKNLKIYTDFNGAELEKNPDLYAVCTYAFTRDIGELIEKVRIEIKYTNGDISQRVVKPTKTEYLVTMFHTITQKRHMNDRTVEFVYNRVAVDLMSILDVIGDTPFHREFLNQVGFHE